MSSIFKYPLIIMLLLMSTTIMAKKDSQYLLTEKTYKALNAAQELMAKDKNVQAEKQLTILLKEVKEGSYEKAVVQQTLGYLYSGQEHYKKASFFFQQALDSKALPNKVSHDLRYNLAQLLLADEQYKKGINLLEQWLKVEPSPNNNAYVLLASANYRIKHYKDTVRYISKAIKNDKSAKESWYQVLLSAYLELKHYKSAIKVLETLITKYPYKKNYWSQLASLYLQQNKEFTALAVKMLAQRLELSDSKTLINLADMYRYLHIPYKSAQLLSKAVKAGTIEANAKNLNKLADSWLASKEDEEAVIVLEKLTKLDKNGESTLKLGRVLFGLEQWQKAVDYLTKSVAKLSGDKLGTASLLLGMTQFHLGNLMQAKTQFSKAVAYKNERNQAGQWLRHVEKLLETNAIKQS